MTIINPALAAAIADKGIPLSADMAPQGAELEPKEGSREWLEQLPRDERWAHTEVLALYGDTVVNPQYHVAIYHLRYAVAEVKRMTDRLAELEEDSRLLASLRSYGVDNWDGYDDAIQAVAS